MRKLIATVFNYSLDGLLGAGEAAVCDPDGRFALGHGSALPGVGARGALRRERGRGDLRLEAGVRDGRAVPARAAAELGSSALGVDSYRCHSLTLAQTAFLLLEW
jgi:hypothetical protein